MRDCRISEDYASPIFKYCNEHPDFTIKQFAKLVKKQNTEKKQIRPHQKKTNGSEDDQIKIWKLIAEKR